MSMADDCRDLADHAKSGQIREQLLEIAEQFERVAKHRLDLLRRPHLVPLRKR
jgi:hypothetical protein